MTCTGKGKHKHCTTKMLTSPAKITASAKGARASLVRAGRLYGTGALTRTGGSSRLVLDLAAERTLQAGAYTLTLSWKTGKITHTSSQRIGIG